MNNTLVRTFTGFFIILFIILPIIFISESFLFFTLVFAFITFMSLYEYHSLLRCYGAVTPLKWLNAVNGALLFITVSLISFMGANIKVLILNWILTLVLIVAELYRKKDKALENMAYNMLGLVWIVLPLSCINLMFNAGLYDGDNHVPALAMFVFIWVNDTGAYVFGLSFGKRPLFARISPKKSWEGLIGGILSVVLAGIFASFFWTGMSVTAWMFFGMIVALGGTFGDLTESLFKRCLNFKDSGSFFPGHGGFLDRFDSVFFTVPLILAYLYFLKNVI